jgi:hypothetical protein
MREPMKARAVVARGAIPLLLAAIHLGVLVWQAPHTVHHFFEHETEKPNECALNAAAERSVGTTVEPVVVVPMAAVTAPAERSAPSLVGLLVLALPSPRAPPRVAA